jgi:hypothetical protein
MRTHIKRAQAPLRRRHSLNLAIAFLDQLWSIHPRGFVFLAARTLDGRWIEKGFHVAFGRGAIERFIRDHNPNTHDFYYSPNAFSKRRRLAEFALSTSLAWCDIDGADPKQFRPQPTILIETSPGRYQGLWKFNTAVEPAQAEAVSRHLTNTYHGDKGGWSITKMLRLPGTLNHKAAYEQPLVRVVCSDDRAIPNWPKVGLARKRAVTVDKVDPTSFDPDAVIKKYWRMLAPNRRRLMQDTSVKSRDRSRIIFMIAAALHDAGATPDEIGAVVWRSPYFISKFGRHPGRLTEEVCRIISKLRIHK